MAEETNKLNEEDATRLREVAHWLLTEAQDTTDVWDEFDVVAYKLRDVADRISESME